METDAQKWANILNGANTTVADLIDNPLATYKIFASSKTEDHEFINRMILKEKQNAPAQPTPQKTYLVKVSALKQNPFAHDFINRQDEVLQMADGLLRNLRYSRMDTNLLSQHKYEFFCSSQMFGSGKSWFGLRFLEELRKNPEYRRILLEKGHSPSDVDILFNATLSSIDFRYSVTMPGWKECIQNALIQAFISTFPQEEQPQHADYWCQQAFNVDEVILMYFAKALGPDRHIYFYFDEIDKIEQACPEIKDNVGDTMSLAERYYYLWELCLKLFNEGHFAFCSGRTSFLITLGRKLHYSNSKASESSFVRCLLFDPLKGEHVKTLLSSSFQFKANHVDGDDDDLKHRFANKIYELTNGIPRFVGLMFQTLRSVDDRPLTPNDLSLLNSDKFIHDYAYQYPNEFNPLLTITKDDKQLATFAHIIRLAVLQVPIDLSKNVNPQHWGIPVTIGAIDFLTVLKMYNLYVRRVEQDLWTIMFPPVVIDYLIQNASTQLQKLGELLPWKDVNGLLKLAKSNVLGNNGKPLENALRICTELRMLPDLAAQDGLTFAQVYPFLEETLIGSKMLIAPNSVVGKLRPFPKVSSNVSSLSSLRDNHEKELRIEKIKSFILGDTSSTGLQIHPSDCQLIIEHVCPASTVYVPLDQSMSADLFQLGADKNFCLHFQAKQTKKDITPSILMDEAAKIVNLNLSGKHTLVFVCIHGPSMTLRQSPSARQIKRKNSDVLDGLHFANNSVINGANKNWTIPSDIDIVVLYQAGVEWLLTKRNVELLVQLENTKDIIEPDKAKKQKI